MRIAILDAVNQDIGLKILFPEADYFVHNSEDATIHDRCNSYNYYNFTPETDLYKINDTNYDYLFIIIALYNIVSGPHFTENIKNIFEKTRTIINNNNFNMVALFDNFDYDYDPNLYIDDLKVDLIFKRNYNKNKIYKDNVRPFPFIMFGNKSLIEKCDRELVDIESYFKKKENRIFFTGCLTSDHHYEYDKDPNVVRDRKYIYDKIQGSIYNPGFLCYEQFKNEISNSKYAIDLLGAGDPNKRTFEILLSGSLMISQYSNLLWPFENGDSFSQETIFKNQHEFFQIVEEFNNNDELYSKCLNNQYEIVKKYFNREWLRNFILRHIRIQYTE
jgi:hypothetical protein